MTNKRYTEPKVYPKSRDPQKAWFVAFRFFNPATGKMQEFQYRDNINSFDNITERLRRAKIVAKSLSELLKDGWNPFEKIIEAEEEKPIIKPLLESIDDLLVVVRAGLTKKSWITYRDMRNQFAKWLISKRYDKIMPDMFSEQKARAYLDYCLVEKKYSGKSHNAHLGFLKSIFTKLLDRSIVKVNPFAKFKELPEKMNENVAFTTKEREKMRTHLRLNNIRLYYAVQFIYYCFFRRTELIELRVGDINLRNNSIRIPGRNAKNGRSESVTIPKSFEPVLYEMGVDRLPQHWYVFGQNFESCEERMAKTDYFTDAHRAELKKVGIRNDCTFYSWKHTGAMQLYLATKDPYVVMRQCRHRDISITMIYLRSLGLLVDEAVRNADFEF